MKKWGNTQNLKLESYKSLITFVKDSAGHDRRYAIDATKLENELGWKADENFDSGIVKTIEWYLGKYKYVKILINKIKNIANTEEKKTAIKLFFSFCTTSF